MRTYESLLIGGYRIVQDTEKYRFTSDAVQLSRFLRAKRGETVADFCAGSGIVGLHFYAENERKVDRVTLFDSDPAFTEMSRETIALNGLTCFDAVCMPVQDLPASYNEAFSLVLCNPPYERADGGFRSAKEARAACVKELTLSLGELVFSASRCLKFGGRFAVVHRADRVAELIEATHVCGLTPKKLQFVAGKEGRKPYAVLLAAVKGGKPGVEVLPTLVNSSGGI